jgi:hypothetical protein
MNSSDGRAILAQIPFDFYGGEIRTLHNIHHTQPVRLNFDRYSPCLSLTDHGLHLARSISISFLWEINGNVNGNFSPREQVLV